MISLLVFVLICWLIWYLVRMLPIDAKVKQVVQIVLIVIALIWLLQTLGMAGHHRFYYHR